jgi:hypothetical protein
MQGVTVTPVPNASILGSGEVFSAGLDLTSRKVGISVKWLVTARLPVCSARFKPHFPGA